MVLPGASLPTGMRACLGINHSWQGPAVSYHDPAEGRHPLPEARRPQASRCEPQSLSCWSYFGFRLCHLPPKQSPLTYWGHSYRSPAGPVEATASVGTRGNWASAQQLRAFHGLTQFSGGPQFSLQPPFPGWSGFAQHGAAGHPAAPHHLARTPPSRLPPTIRPARCHLAHTLPSG